MNGADALIKALADAGVDVCFANPGTSEMHFVAALDGEPKMKAVLALFEGVASIDDIDAVVTLGMNHPMGPLRLADMIGLDTCLSIMNVLHEGFKDSKYRPCPLLQQMVDAGQLGKKSGQGFYSYP